MKKTIVIIFILLGILFCFIVLTVSTKTGALYITVLNAYDMSPIENATVFITDFPTNNNKSDYNGKVFLSSIPLLHKDHISRVTSYDYYLVQIVALAEGYLPCIWQNVQVFPTKGAKELIIYMFPNELDSFQTTVFFEAVPDSILRSYIESFELRK